MKAREFVFEKWSEKYKSSINCSHPRGFSQRAHCAGKKKHNESIEMEMVCEDCGMCQTHGNLSEIKQRLDPKCWTGKKIGNPKTKIKGGIRVNNCVPAESIEEAANAAQQAAIAISMKKAGKKPKNESAELEEEFDLIESIIERLAEHNGVDAEVIWEDLETLTEDELYAFAVTSEPIMESQGMAEATGDEKFDTMMGQMQREPTIPDPQMPPTDVKDLYQWAVKNNKPYHKIFAKWANREGYKSVAPALQKAGNLDSDALDYWTPRVWEIYWGEVRGIDSEMPPEWAKKRIPDELRDYLDTVFDAYDRIVFDWPTEYRQIGQQGMAEDWQKANKRDRTAGMSQKAVNAYRRENPGSKLKTAVTTKPSKLKKGGKASKRRKSYCSRSRGQMKMHSISCAKTPDKAICKARRRWNC